MLLKRLESTKRIWIEKKLARANNIHGSIEKPSEAFKPAKIKEKRLVSSPENPHRIRNQKSNK